MALEPEEQEKTPLPCPVCGSLSHVGIWSRVAMRTDYAVSESDSYVQHAGNLARKGDRMLVMGDSMYCARCGLMSVPTTTPSFIVGMWNRLVRRILAKNPEAK